MPWTSTSVSNFRSISVFILSGSKTNESTNQHTDLQTNKIKTSRRVISSMDRRFPFSHGGVKNYSLDFDLDKISK